MYFLRCNNCGHLNEVITETLIFCGKCNKKLENNFRDWKSRKPERTFEEFKLTLCVSDSELKPKVTLKKPQSNRLVKWLSLIFILAILFTVVYYFKGKLLDYIKYGVPLKYNVEQAWVEEEYGEDGLRVMTPFRLKPEEMTFPDDEKASIEKASSFSYWTSANFYIIITSIRYVPQVEGILSLRTAANVSIAKIKEQEGISNFYYKEDHIYYNDIPGFKQTGYLVKDKDKLEFINVGYIEAAKFYQILVVHEADDIVTKKIAERIINSIKIEKYK